ncbi:ricin-type beta-trefoil lectin domain protein [Ceratobasidium sp. AG-Ba]|nr:ricin-type beta-trefoil lectin domain protein [Ceratobasidium sp. AG-Ba]
MSNTTLLSGPCYLLNVFTSATTEVDLLNDIFEKKTKVQRPALNGKDNQKWIIQSEPNGYTVKNVASGTYLGFPAGDIPQTDKPLTATSNRLFFDIVGDEKNNYVFYVRWVMPVHVLDTVNDSQTGSPVI